VTELPQILRKALRLLVAVPSAPNATTLERRSSRRYEVARRVCFVPEAGKAEDSRKIRERDAEREECNPPLCFCVKYAGHNRIGGCSWPSCVSSVVRRRRLGN
jgi:hypothetical protein